MTHGWLVAKQQIPNFKQLLMLGYLTGNLNQDFMCQQTACTLTLKERNSSGSLCSITTRPWGHRHQFCSQKNRALWLFGSCAGYQPRPEKKLEWQSPSWSIFLDPKKGLRQSRICIQLYTWKCCSSISNNINLNFVFTYNQNQLNATVAAQSQAATILNLEVRAYRKDRVLDKSFQIKIE